MKREHRAAQGRVANDPKKKEKKRKEKKGKKGVRSSSPHDPCTATGLIVLRCT
jgi:hypothetical protein